MESDAIDLLNRYHFILASLYVENLHFRLEISDAPDLHAANPLEHSLSLSLAHKKAKRRKRQQVNRSAKVSTSM